jgi:hypothetical protein
MPSILAPEIRVTEPLIANVVVPAGLAAPGCTVGLTRAAGFAGTFGLAADADLVRSLVSVPALMRALAAAAI